MLLVKGRGELAVLPAVTAVLLNQTAMDIWNEGNIVISGKRGNCGIACTYCGTVYHNAMDIRNEGYVVSTGKRGNCGFAWSYCS